jgi:hypothetical protein
MNAIFSLLRGASLCASDIPPSPLEMSLIPSGGKLMIGFAKVTKGAIKESVWNVDFNADETKLFYSDRADLVENWGIDESQILQSERIPEVATVQFGRGESQINSVRASVISNEKRLDSISEVGVDGLLGFGRESQLGQRYPIVELKHEANLIKMRATPHGLIEEGGSKLAAGFLVEAFPKGGSRFGMKLRSFSMGHQLKVSNPLVVFDPSIEVIILPSRYFGLSQGRVLSSKCDSEGKLTSPSFPITLEFTKENKVSISNRSLHFLDSPPAGKCVMRIVTWERDEIVIGRLLLASVDRIIIHQAESEIRIVPRACSSCILLQSERVSIVRLVDRDWFVQDPAIVTSPEGTETLVLRKVSASVLDKTFVANRIGRFVVIIEADPRSIMKRRIDDLFQPISFGRQDALYAVSFCTDGLHHETETHLAFNLLTKSCDLEKEELLQDFSSSEHRMDADVAEVPAGEEIEIVDAVSAMLALAGAPPPKRSRQEDV